MKKIGNLYTIRGQVPVNTVNHRIQLFDGRFDTAFRIVSFAIAGGAPLENNEFQGVLATDEMSVATSFDWSDNIEIAWAVWNAPNVYSGPEVSFIDPDNLVVEDLYFTNRGGTDDTFLNYLVTMQKYDISDWQGALSMVRNRSQA
jgi:hypothetical protein